MALVSGGVLKMNPVRKLEIACDERKAVKIFLTDGLICERATVEEWNGAYFFLNVSDDIIRKCREFGRYRICALMPEEIKDVEFLD